MKIKPIHFLLPLAILSIILIKNNTNHTSNFSSQLNANTNGSFQWQLSSYPINTSNPAKIFDVDLFETPVSTIQELHKQNKKVICYINVGAYEEYREDAKAFPRKILGNNYEGWEGEKWLDISNYQLFSNILLNRFDLAKEKGCDGIEPDNIEGYQENTGFDITYKDQLIFNTWLAKEAHSRNLSIGLKNDPEQVDDLVNIFDWALIEDCHQWGFCDEFKPFINKKKTVFQVEYTDNKLKLNDFCKQSANNGYIGILKNRELDSWIESCQSNSYQLHKNITATLFWIGEKSSTENGYIHNKSSAWVEDWVTTYGGIDDPKMRNGYFPEEFIPKENPFYFALPYNNLDNNGNQKTNAPQCKNRWIVIIYKHRKAYAQWEDVGPFGEDDYDYVFGNAKPRNDINNSAGLDLSPAVSDYLELSGVDTVNWQFVDEIDIPDGPWKTIITK